MASAETHPVWPRFEYLAVAEAVAAAGERHRAWQLVADAERMALDKALLDHNWYSLVAIAGTAADVGALGLAEHVARAITDPQCQAQALTRIANTTVSGRADLLLGTAFAVGSWTTPLGVLARRHPTTLLAIIAAIYGNSAFAA